MKRKLRKRTRYPKRGGEKAGTTKERIKENTCTNISTYYNMTITNERIY
jgi:hypothetical protein